MLDLYRGRLSARRAANLAAWLPDGSAVYISDGSDHAWRPEAYILRGIDLDIRSGNWQRGGGKGEKPKPIPTPAEAAAEATAAMKKAARAEAARDRHLARVRAQRSAG